MRRSFGQRDRTEPAQQRQRACVVLQRSGSVAGVGLQRRVAGSLERGKANKAQ